MRRLLWGISARRDLYTIARRYGEIDPDLPLILLERIETAPLILLDNPGLGSPFAGKLRKWPVKRTPFVLLYRAAGGDIQIRRVLDARSDLVGRLR